MNLSSLVWESVLIKKENGPGVPVAATLAKVAVSENIFGKRKFSIKFTDTVIAAFRSQH